MSGSTPETMHEHFMQAFNSGGLDGLMELYEPGIVFTAQPGQAVEGTEQVRGVLQGMMALGGPIDLRPVEILKSDDLALVISHWTLEGTGPDGNPLSLASNTVEVIRRGDDGSWRYVIDNPWGAPSTEGAE
jgi:ketosteroid isomerase-like protein